MQFGNVIGSNIFNILLIIGTSAAIHPIIYNHTYNFDVSILICSIILLGVFSLLPPRKILNRPKGVVYIMIYIMYICILSRMSCGA